MWLIDFALTRIRFIPWQGVLGVWLVYLAACIVLTWEGTPHLKQRLYRRYILTGAVLIVLSPFALGYPLLASFLLIGPIALLIAACMWRSPFCPTCGVLVMPLPPFPSPDTCFRCGADMAHKSGAV